MSQPQKSPQPIVPKEKPCSSSHKNQKSPSSLGESSPHADESTYCSPPLLVKFSFLSISPPSPQSARVRPGVRPGLALQPGQGAQPTDPDQQQHSSGEEREESGRFFFVFPELSDASLELVSNVSSLLCVCVWQSLSQRATHMSSADQKRRTHIKSGFKTLCSLVPTLKTQSNVSPTPSPGQAAFSLGHISPFHLSFLFLFVF